MKDIDKAGYPLPCDPVTGSGWWRFNVSRCMELDSWRRWQAGRKMDEIIPVLRWTIYGPITHSNNATLRHVGD